MFGNYYWKQNQWESLWEMLVDELVLYAANPLSVYSDFLYTKIGNFEIEIGWSWIDCSFYHVLWF